MKWCRDEKEERTTFETEKKSKAEVKLCSLNNPSLTQIPSICSLQIAESTYFFIQEYYILGKQQWFLLWLCPVISSNEIMRSLFSAWDVLGFYLLSCYFLCAGRYLIKENTHCFAEIVCLPVTENSTQEHHQISKKRQAMVTVLGCKIVFPSTLFGNQLSEKRAELPLFVYAATSKLSQHITHRVTSELYLNTHVRAGYSRNNLRRSSQLSGPTATAGSTRGYF